MQAAFGLSDELNFPEKSLLITWSGLALLLHIGVVAMRVKDRHYSKTLELSGVWFALALFGFSLWFFLFFVGGTQLNAAFRVNCPQNDLHCIVSALLQPRNQLIFSIMMVWLLATYAGLVLLGLLSLIYSIAILGRGYRIRTARSVGAVVVACLINVSFAAGFHGGRRTNQNARRCYCSS